MNVLIKNNIKVAALFEEYNLRNYEICDFSIGNDEQIHILLAETFIFQTQSSVHYQALSIMVDWADGNIIYHTKIDFGSLEPDLHFIQRLHEGYLLLGGRARKYKDGSEEQNALITDGRGNVLKTFCFGDGIRQCIVDSKNRIITSYFDQGVFGNYGWNQPVGACGLIVWSSDGERLWENKNHDICDCYAINIDSNDNLWYYYYTKFDLVATDYNKETVYHPEISGSGGFLLDLRANQLIFDEGYNKHGNFISKKIEGEEIIAGEKVFFIWNEEQIISDRYSFRGSKALLNDENNTVYYADLNN